MNVTEFILMNQMENGTRLLNECCSIFKKSGDPIVRATTALERGDFFQKVVKTIHFIGSEETIELNLRTIDYFCESVRYLRSSSRFITGGDVLNMT